MGSKDIQYKIDNITKIAQNRNISTTDLLIEIINAEIKTLEEEKLNLQIDYNCNGDKNAKQQIQNIFEIIDNFNAQKKLYYKIKK